MNVISIPLEQIEVGDRLRGINPDWVEFLAGSMLDRGQDTPIQVRRIGRGDRYALIAGAHRMAALEKAGIATAAASVVQATPLQATLLEIDENLIRRELSALDRATFLARRKEVYEELHPETKRGGDRKSDQAEARFGLITFSRSTAERLGITERSVEIAVARYRNISGATRVAIAGTWLAESGRQLDELAKLTPDMQRQVAEFVIAHPDVKAVSQIVAALENKPKTAPPTHYDRFLALWSKADAQTRLRIAEFVAPQIPMREAA